MKYNVGDKLFEGIRVAKHGVLTPTIRTWVVLSVIQDPEWIDDDGQPVEVVTMRTKIGPSYCAYKAECSVMLAGDLKTGVWRRSRKEALAMIASWCR